MIIIRDISKEQIMSNTAKDYMGNPLEVGDEVIYMLVSYRTLRKGTITKITDKMVFIDENIKQAPKQLIATKYIILNTWR